MSSAFVVWGCFAPRDGQDGAAPIHAAVSMGCSGESWREMMENLSPHLPLLSACQLDRALLSALQSLVVMLKTCQHRFVSRGSQNKSPAPYVSISAWEWRDGAVSEIRESNSVVTLVGGGLSLCRKHLCRGRINWHKTAKSFQISELCTSQL